MYIDCDPPEVTLHIVMSVDEAMAFLSQVEFTEFLQQVRHQVQAALTGIAHG